MLSIKEFKKIVRICIDELDKSDEYTARDSLKPMRTALEERGHKPGCHSGRNDLSDDETVEWYAGQALEVVDTQAWHCVESVIASLDRFCPEDLDNPYR